VNMIRHDNPNPKTIFRIVKVTEGFQNDLPSLGRKNRSLGTIRNEVR
jgi:hypothetical protein